jgi:RNA polymerase sigma-70 factor (ECF subfamily)
VTAPGKAGHAEVFAEVVKLRALIRAVLVRSGAPWRELDDLMQDCMLRAWRRIGEGGFQPLDPTRPLGENVAAWVVGIARRVASEARYTRARQREMFAQETQRHPVDIDAIVPSPEARAEAREELEVFARVKLSPAHREVVDLAAQGYTAKQIGELLGIPEDTASTRLKRARRAFREALVRWRR